MSSFNFYSLVSAVKDTSSKALATLSSDLKEFSTTVQGDMVDAAKEVKKKVEATLAERAEQKQQAETEETKDANATGAGVTSTVTASIFALGSRLESVGAKLLTSADEFLGTWTADEPLVTPPEELSSGRRFRLLALQEATDTYVEPPADFETYQKWRLNLSVDDFHSLQAEVLEHYPAVKEKLDSLVPSTLDADSFWGHYLYKASLLAAQEQRGALLLEKVEDDDEDIAWDLDSPPAAASSLELDHEEKRAPEAETTDTPTTAPSEEGWVDVTDKKNEAVKKEVTAVDDEEAVDWGDDEPVDDLTVKPATTEASADDWGQWE